MYSDQLWFDRPQGIFLAYQAALALFGGSTEAIRLNGALWSAGTTIFVVLIAYRAFNLRVAAVAGPLFAVISVAPLIDGYVANAEVFMVAGTTASTYAIWRRHWLLAGLALGVAILLKPSGVVGLLLGVAWLHHVGASRRDWLRFMGGAAVPLLAAFVHGVLTVGAHDYLYAVAFFRLVQRGEGDPLLQLIDGWSRVTPVIVPLLFTVLAGHRVLRATPTQYRFLAIWLGTTLLGIALGGNWWEHYFLQAIPPLAIMAAVTLCAAADAIARSWRTRWAGIARRWDAVGASGAATVAAGAAFVVLILPWARMDPIEGSTALYEMTGYQLNDEIGAYIASQTTEDDEIFVGLSHASLVYLSGRRSFTPYLYKQQTAAIPNAIDDIADGIRDGEPAVLLLIPSQLDRYDPEGRIWDATRERYVFDRAFGAAEVWRRR